MTPRSRSIVEWIAVIISAGVFAAGATWGTTEAQLVGKLDEHRFLTDSTRRDEREHARDARIEDALRRVEAGQQETNERLREIVCPPNARGCR